jgi:hypothetical protein
VVLSIEYISFFSKTLFPSVLAPFGALNRAFAPMNRRRVRVKIPGYRRGAAWFRGWLPRQRNIPKVERPNIDLDAISVDVHMDVESATQGNKMIWKDSRTTTAHTR